MVASAPIREELGQWNEAHTRKNVDVVLVVLRDERKFGWRDLRSTSVHEAELLKYERSEQLDLGSRGGRVRRTCWAR